MNLRLFALPIVAAGLSIVVAACGTPEQDIDTPNGDVEVEQPTNTQLNNQPGAAPDVDDDANEADEDGDDNENVQPGTNGSAGNDD
ncbi:hypothetical protein IFO70_13210 [Phormidium tenue FACHB-886]|nr:hypothetical protein [Phormidium tenue FACHB-886]